MGLSIGLAMGKAHKMTLATNLHIPTQPPESYESFKNRVQGTNINQTTLLATDYLNHFNEIIMLVDMISDMPECIEDVAAWKPKTYQDHFRDSGFSDKGLAVAAYDHSPAYYQAPFERIVDQLNGAILQVAAKLVQAAARNNAEEIAAAALFGPELRLLVEKAGAIINGDAEGMDQAHVDAMLNA